MARRARRRASRGPRARAPPGRRSPRSSRARMAIAGRHGAAQQHERTAEQHAAVDVRPDDEQGQHEPDPAVGLARVACEQPDQRREQGHGERLRPDRGGEEHQHHRRRDGGRPGRGSAEPACCEHRDQQRAHQQAGIEQRDEPQPAERVEPVRRDVGEPLLILPRAARGQGHQAIASWQPVLHDVAPGDEIEPGVAGDARRRAREQCGREQQERQREDRVRDRTSAALIAPRRADPRTVSSRTPTSHASAGARSMREGRADDLGERAEPSERRAARPAARGERILDGAASRVRADEPRGERIARPRGVDDVLDRQRGARDALVAAEGDAPVRSEGDDEQPSAAPRELLERVDQRVRPRGSGRRVRGGSGARGARRTRPDRRCRSRS